MDVLESNKLIAEFMGAKYDKDTRFPMHQDDLWLPIHGICNYTTIEVGRGKTLRYHNSWDWLMPVVEKIESLLPDDSIVTIEYKDCLIPILNDQEPFTIHTNRDTKLEAVYYAVLQFIQWYNQQNRNV